MTGIQLGVLGADGGCWGGTGGAGTQLGELGVDWGCWDRTQVGALGCGWGDWDGTSWVNWDPSGDLGSLGGSHCLVFFGGGLDPFWGILSAWGGSWVPWGGLWPFWGVPGPLGGGGPGCLGGVVLDPFGGGPACVAPHPPTLPPSRRCSCLRLGPPQTSTPPNSPPRHPPIPLPPPSPACFCLFIPCCPTPHSPPILSSKSSPPPSPQPVPVSPNPPPPQCPQPPGRDEADPPGAELGPGRTWGGVLGTLGGNTAGVTGRGLGTHGRCHGEVGTRVCHPDTRGEGDTALSPPP